ncbi:hypothetical protein GV794_08630 [Nocardia cyriacigeorgica]|uniref:Nuclear transport factor 2 family protein n=1 Tax=Nocardia cyriacigeorgica TaxID=135487 RepID=A0ABX0CGU3_9NOCA|nr:hypothetical protein [Nocardia cyriacigeorgica]NEW50975.1 hypothetical protein [Nocardia cyriacigeorgica]NEW55715.1 hypothetical protein [Nocardia cyriacigeorgica]
MIAGHRTGATIIGGPNRLARIPDLAVLFASPQTALLNLPTSGDQSAAVIDRQKRTLVKRTLAVGLVFVAMAAVGCGSEESTATDDAQQIRDLMVEQETAMATFDFDKMATLTCTKYREEVRNLSDTMFPPISEAGTPEELAATGADVLIPAMKASYPTASDESISQLVDALIRYDEPAYKAANLDILRQTTTVKIDKIENISVTGDTATADITSTWVHPGEQPAPEVAANAFLKEDGKWLDCQQPS